MLDPHILRNDLDKVYNSLVTKGISIDKQQYNSLELRRKELEVKYQQLQNQRNTKSKNVAEFKSLGKDISDLITQLNSLKLSTEKVDRELSQIKDDIYSYQLNFANLPHESVPVGRSANDNVEVRKWGVVRNFNFELKSHYQLSDNLDFNTASYISGSRFVVLKGDIALLHRALIQFMLDKHTIEHGYEEVYVPYLVNESSAFGTGQLPKFSDDLFKVDKDGLFLIPTAEVPLTNLVRNRILLAKELPIRFVAHTPCFRREAGSYGKDTKGLIRQHQFDKVELVQITTPDNSFEALNQIRKNAENILQELYLPYRVVELCTADLGFSAAKTYDLEVWIPSENCYREISSCSNMTDFQARRLKARFRSDINSRSNLVHTLNGSALAVGRTLLAVLENYQQKDGSVEVPKVLRRYMNNKSIINLIR